MPDLAEACCLTLLPQDIAVRLTLTRASLGYVMHTRSLDRVSNVSRVA